MSRPSIALADFINQFLVLFTQKKARPPMNEDQIDIPMSETMNILVFVFMVFLVVMMTVGGAYVVVG